VPLRCRAVPVWPVLTSLAVLAALALAPPASASPSMLSVIQDDNQLIYGSGQQRESALASAVGVGADSVRVTVLWKAVAHTRRRIRRANDPAAYPPGQWDRYDDLVRSATSRGLRVYLNVTAPGPSWAHARTRSRKNRGTWKPNASQYGRFFTAVARRYSGIYKDENQGNGVLPRVSWWSFQNEPNQGGWITPQSARYRGVRGAVPTSPHIFRRLVIAGAKALLRTGHQNDVVLFGELAPIGVPPSRERRPLRPALFIREMFCLNNRLRRFGGAQRRARGCANVKGLRVLKRFPNLGFGHHPYTRRLRPTQRFKGRDSISIANISALPALLDRIARRTRLINPGLPIYLTEFGYETNPPDVLHGISPQIAAEYENQGDYLAYRHPRVFSQTHFQLLDVPPQTQFKVNSDGYWRTYQSGLLFQNGQPKLVAFAWTMPLWIEPKAGRTFTVWGGLRFTPNGQPQQVQLQFRQPGGGYFNSGDPINVTNQYGWYETTRDIPPGTTIWRAVWFGPEEGQMVTSREVEVR
jgi:hypothetical protein